MFVPAQATDPAQVAELAESVSLALYVVMDALTPAERVSFVLHDVFDVPFDAIAGVLGRSTAATKMLASRARGRLRVGPPPAGENAAARAVVDAFFSAAARGDVAGLLTALAPDIELHPSGHAIIRGATTVATQAARFARGDATIQPALVDDLPGVLVSFAGRPVTVLAFTLTGGVISRIQTVTDPARLAQIVPSWAR